MRFKNAEAILSGGVSGAVNDTVACDDRLVYRNLGGGEDYGQEDPILCFSTCLGRNSMKYAALEAFW